MFYSCYCYVHRRLLGNNSNAAGRFWPGYFKVDTTTPGKEWVAEFRRNQKLKALALAKREPGMLPHQGIRGAAIT